MNTNELIKRWKAEEEIAHIHGWDFSHIEGRYMEEDDLPWDYREEILGYLKPEMRILDIDTGGGEFLLSLNHPHTHTAATENIRPTWICAGRHCCLWGLISGLRKERKCCPLRMHPLIW